MATHGADQLIVQRLLACRTLGDARKAIVGSGFLVLVQMTLFVTIGISLFAFFQARPIAPGVPGAFASPDDIFPTYIVKHLPPLISAYLVAGMFSAAMCSESSALNSLASALAMDIVAPLMGKKYVEGKRGLVLGKLLTLLWTLVLAGLAVGFSRLPQNVPAVQVALGLASVTAGGLLGGFLLALWARKATQTDAMIGIATSAVFMFVLWLGSKGFVPFPLGKMIAWPWYSLLGSTIAFGTGWLLSLRHSDR
jgi:Na+/proline symporter